MYIKDINILYYVGIAILGAIIGIFINWCNVRLPENKKVFSKEMFDKTKRPKFNYWLVIIMAILYVGLLYNFGIRKNILFKFGLNQIWSINTNDNISTSNRL